MSSPLRNNSDSDSEQELRVEVDGEGNHEAEMHGEISVEDNHDPKMNPQMEVAIFQGDLDDYNLESSEDSVNGNEENNGNEEHNSDGEHNGGDINPATPVSSDNSNDNIPSSPATSASSREVYNSDDEDDTSQASAEYAQPAMSNRKKQNYYRQKDEEILVDPKLETKLFKFYFMKRKKLVSSQRYYKKEKRQLYAECVEKTRIIELLAKLKKADKQEILIPLPRTPTRIKNRLGIKGNMERQRMSIINRGGLEKYMRRHDRLQKINRNKNKIVKIKKEGQETAIGKKRKDYGIKPFSILINRLPKQKSPTPSTSGTSRHIGRKIPEITLSSDDEEEEEMDINRCLNREITENEVAIPIPFEGSSSLQNILEGFGQDTGTRPIALSNIEIADPPAQNTSRDQQVQEISTPGIISAKHPSEGTHVDRPSNNLTTTTPSNNPTLDLESSLVSANQPEGETYDDQPLDYSTNNPTTATSQTRPSEDLESSNISSANLIDAVNNNNVQPLDYTMRKPTTTTSRSRSTDDSHLHDFTPKSPEDQDQPEKGHNPSVEKKGEYK